MELAAGPAGLDPVATGLLLGATSTVSLAVIAPAGWAANRWGSQRLVLTSGLLTLVGVLALPRAPGSVGLFVAALVYGLGVGVLGVAGALHVFSLRGWSTGRLVSVYRLSTDAIQVIGPLRHGRHA